MQSPFRNSLDSKPLSSVGNIIAGTDYQVSIRANSHVSVTVGLKEIIVTQPGHVSNILWQQLEAKVDTFWQSAIKLIPISSPEYSLIELWRHGLRAYYCNEVSTAAEGGMYRLTEKRGSVSKSWDNHCNVAAHEVSLGQDDYEASEGSPLHFL